MTLSGRPVFRPRLRRRTAIVLCTVLALTALAGTAEALVRHRIAGRVAAVAGERLGTTPDVGLGATPALWQVARGSLPDVELTANGVSARHMTGLAIDAHLRQVRRSGQGGTVGSSSVTVDIGATSLATTGGSGPDTEVVPDPAHGRLVVHVGRAGALTVPVTPVLAGRQIRLTPGRPEFAGAPLPDALAKRITAEVSRTVALTDLPLELAPRRLEVTDDGLRLTLSGGHAAFRA
ncbi:LmeA family phospholipid-binding protein [Streptomyces echinatus]|uniref:LmeA family phospholipid-binding protein n=1 Tax=Streptomyces echinatus TaxID=67293 RepID=UPI0038027398